MNRVANTIVLNTNIDLFSARGLDSLPKNRTADVILMNRMFVYSAMKIRANSPLLYSVLNPDTSSDSPSAKSNGDRFVSAKVVVNHINISGSAINATQDFCEVEMIVQSILCSINRHEIKINAILTSYEIVCATPRSLPNNEYLEFEHHPAVNVGYTFILDTHRKYRIPNCMNIAWKLCGYRIHIITAKVNLIVGAAMNKIVFDIVGFACSFTNSLIASANGTGIPNSLGLLGPFRIWKYPNSFRSINV